MNQKTSLQTGLFPRLPLKAISLFTVIAFLCSDLLFFPTHALAQTRNPSNVRGGVDTSLLASASAASGNAQELVIPPGIGTIQEMEDGRRITDDERAKSRLPLSDIRHPSSGFVFLIQDAHSVPDAQRSLEQLIEYLQEKYGVSTVALEGAQGKLDPTLFRLFPDEKKRKELFSAHLDSGELSGAAVASVLSSHKADYVGIEDWKLYQEGVDAFLKGLEQRVGLEAQIANLKNELQALKQKYYSEEALGYDAELNAWYADPNRFSRFLDHLLKFEPLCPATSVLKSLFQTLGHEKNGLGPAVENEIKALAIQTDRMIKNGPERSRLNALKQASRTGRISHAELACELQRFLPEDQKISEALRQVIKNHQKLATLKGREFTKELDSFLGLVRGELFRTLEAKAVAGLDEQIRLLEKLTQFELSREEWKLLQQDGGWRMTDGVRSQEIRASEKKFLSVQQQLFAGDFFHFYEIAIKRESVFLSKLSGLVETPSTLRLPPSVAVVTGGFHTFGLAAHLRKQGIPYAVISPAIQEVPQDDRYIDQMQGKVSWQRYLRPRSGKIDLYDAFARATVDRLSGATATGRRAPNSNLKEWRDSIIRELAAEGRVAEHSQYTRYIDEVITENSEEFEALKKKWTVQLEKFIGKLQSLGRAGQITEVNISKLLSQPANQTPYAAASLVPGNFLKVRGRELDASLEGGQLLPAEVPIPSLARLSPRYGSEGLEESKPASVFAETMQGIPEAGTRSELREVWKKVAGAALVAGAIAGAVFFQDHFVKTFLTIFFVVNPIGSAVTFLSMTGALKDASERKILSKKSLLAATGVGALFLFAGNLLFNFIGITLGTFMIAGGALLFTISLTSLTSSTSDRRLDPKEMGVVPLGIPLIVGPATLTTLMILRGQYGWPVVASAFLSNMLLTAVLFRYSEKVIKVLGKEGAKVIGKIFNLLLAALGVTLIVKGLITVFPGLHSDTVRPLSIPAEKPAVEAIENNTAPSRSEVREDATAEVVKRLMAAAALARQKDKERFWGETALSPQALVAGLVASKRGWRPYQEAEHVLLEAAKWVLNTDPGEIPSSEEAWGTLLSNKTALELFRSVPSDFKRSELRAQESHVAPDLEFTLPHSEADNAKHAAGDLLIKINEILQIKLLKGYFSVFELARSTVQYGEGGMARVYVERGPDGTATGFKLVVEDQGPGLSAADPNIHFKNGEQFHSKRIKRPEGWLLSKIGREPDSMALEYQGSRWDRESPQGERTVRFKKTGPSDIRTGMRTTLTFSLSAARSEMRSSSSSSSEERKKRRPLRRSDGKESKWAIFDRFVKKINLLSPEQVVEVDEIEQLNQKREKLLEWGITEAAEVDGRYLVSAIQKIVEKRKKEIPEEKEVVWTDLLSYGGIGRYLIAYKDEDPDDGWVVKIPNSEGNLRYIDLYALNGARIAQQRLGGLAAMLMIFDGRQSGKTFFFNTADRGPIRAPVAIVQEKLLPFVEYLKQIGRRGASEAEIEKAIDYVEKYKQFVIAMYKRGVVDIDNFNIVGNYGVRKSDQSVAVFDVGDLSDTPRDAENFVAELKGFNETIAESLEEIDGVFLDRRISAHFKKNPFRKDDFIKAGKDLFGSDYDPQKSGMVFPYTENEVRQMFAGGQFKETLSKDPRRSEVRSLPGPAVSKTGSTIRQENPWKASGVGAGQFLSLDLGLDTKTIFDDFQNRDGHWNAVQIEGMDPAWLDLKEGASFYRRLSEKMEFLAAYIRFYLPKDVEPRLYEMADEQGWPFFRTEERKLGFVLTEMVKNAIVHGHKLDLTLPVLVHWELDRKGNVFVIRVANKVMRDDRLVKGIGAANIRDVLRLGGEGRAESMIREMTGGNIPLRSTLKDGTVIAKLEIPVEKRSEMRVDTASNGKSSGIVLSANVDNYHLGAIEAEVSRRLWPEEGEKFKKWIAEHPLFLLRQEIEWVLQEKEGVLPEDQHPFALRTWRRVREQIKNILTDPEMHLFIMTRTPLHLVSRFPVRDVTDMQGLKKYVTGRIGVGGISWSQWFLDSGFDFESEVYEIARKKNAKPFYARSLRDQRIAARIRGELVRIFSSSEADRFSVIRETPETLKMRFREKEYSPSGSSSAVTDLEEKVRVLMAGKDWKSLQKLPPEALSLIQNNLRSLGKVDDNDLRRLGYVMDHLAQKNTKAVAERRSEMRADAQPVFEWAGKAQGFDGLHAAWEAKALSVLREFPEAKTDKAYWDAELAERIEQGRNFIDYKEPDLFEKRKDSHPIVHLESILKSDEVGFLKTFYYLTGKDEESIILRREGPLFVLEYQKIYHADSPASARYIIRLNFGTHGLRTHVQAHDMNTSLKPVSPDQLDQAVSWKDLGLPDGYLPGVRFYGDGSFDLILDPAVLSKLENLTVPFVRFESRSEVRNQEAVQAEIDRSAALKNGARMRARQFLKYNRELIQWFLALKDARARNTEEAKEEQSLILEKMRDYAVTLKEISRHIRPDAGEGLEGEQARYKALDDYAVTPPAGISQGEVTVALTAESRKLKEEIAAIQKEFLEAHRAGDTEMLRQLNAKAAALYKARLKAQLLQASSYLLESRIDEMALLTVLTAIRIGYLKLSHEYGWRVRRALQEAAIRKIQVVGREGDVAQVYDYENFKMATAPDKKGKQDPVTIIQDVWVRKDLEDGTVTYQPEKREFVFKDLATAVRRSFHILLNQEVDFAQVYDRINDLDYGIDLLRTSGDVLPDYAREDIRESVDFIMNGRHGGLKKGRVDEKGNAAANIRTAMAELEAHHTEKAVEMFEAAKKELELRLETLVGKKSGISSQAQYLIHQYRRQETARAMRELATLVENGDFEAGYQLLKILYKTHYLHRALEDSQYASLQWHVIDLGTSLKRLAANKERLSVASQENALRYVNDTIRRIQTMTGFVRSEARDQAWLHDFIMNMQHPTYSFNFDAQENPWANYKIPSEIKWGETEIVTASSESKASVWQVLSAQAIKDALILSLDPALDASLIYAWASNERQDLTSNFQALRAMLLKKYQLDESRATELVDLAANLFRKNPKGLYHLESRVGAGELWRPVPSYMNQLRRKQNVYSQMPENYLRDYERRLDLIRSEEFLTWVRGVLASAGVKAPVKAIYLYGSYIYGFRKSPKDIDFMVIVDEPHFDKKIMGIDLPQGRIFDATYAPKTADIIVYGYQTLQARPLDYIHSAATAIALSHPQLSDLIAEADSPYHKLILAKDYFASFEKKMSRYPKAGAVAPAEELFNYRATALRRLLEAHLLVQSVFGFLAVDFREIKRMEEELEVFKTFQPQDLESKEMAPFWQGEWDLIGLGGMIKDAWRRSLICLIAEQLSQEAKKITGAILQSGRFQEKRSDALDPNLNRHLQEMTAGVHFLEGYLNDHGADPEKVEIFVQGFDHERIWLQQHSERSHYWLNGHEGGQLNFRDMHHRAFRNAIVSILKKGLSVEPPSDSAEEFWDAMLWLRIPLVSYFEAYLIAAAETGRPEDIPYPSLLKESIPLKTGELPLDMMSVYGKQLESALQKQMPFVHWPVTFTVGPGFDPIFHKFGYRRTGFRSLYVRQDLHDQAAFVRLLQGLVALSRSEVRGETSVAKSAPSAVEKENLPKHADRMAYVRGQYLPVLADHLASIQRKKMIEALRLKELEDDARTVFPGRSEMRSPDPKEERPGHHELAISHIAGWRIRGLVRGIFEMIEAHPVLAALPWSVVRNGDHHVSMSLHKSKDHPSISFNVGTKWFFWVSVETTIRMNGSEPFQASFWGSSRYVLSSTSKKFDEWFEKMPLPPDEPATGRSEMRSGLPLKAVVLDIGNVIFDIDFSRMARAFRSLGGRVGSTEGIINLAINSELYSKFERDEITPRIYRESLCGLLGVGELATEKFSRIFSDIFTLKPETVELIKQAKKSGAKIFFLSDTNRFHMDYLRAHYPQVFSLADHVFTSYELKARKGDGPRVFRLLGDKLRRDYGMKPKDVVFFDDLKWNIEAAHKAGFPAEVFTSARQAQDAIVRRAPLFINNADDLSNYVHSLAAEIGRGIPDGAEASLPEIIQTPEKHFKDFYAPLYELFLTRLQIDFEGAEDFVGYARGILRAGGVKALRDTMGFSGAASDKSLRLFRKIRVGKNTPEALVEFYGQILFFLTKEMENYLGPIYDAIMATRPTVAIARQGKSYHNRAESTIRLFDKEVLFASKEAEDNYQFKRDSMFDRTRLRTQAEADEPQKARAAKILKAVEVWEKQAVRLKVPFLRERIEHFRKYAVVVAYGPTLPLIVADTEQNVFRAVHTERLTNTFYFSSAYLDSLNPEDAEDMKELATWLNFGQEWLDIYRNIYGAHSQAKINKMLDRAAMLSEDPAPVESSEASIAETIEEERSKLNIHFFTAGEDIHLLSSARLQERMAKRMREHVLKRYKDIMPLIFSEEEEAEQLLKQGQREGGRDPFGMALVLYKKLLSRCEAMGMHTCGQRIFSKIVYATHGVQLYDEGGLLPHHLQMDLVLLAARLGRWGHLLNELEILLKGKAYSKPGLDPAILEGELRKGYPVPMSQVNMDQVTILLGENARTSLFARKLRSTMASRLLATPPESFMKVEAHVENANRMLEDFFRAPFSELRSSVKVRSEVRSDLPADFSENVRQQLMRAIAHFSQTIDQSSEVQVRAMEQFIVNNLEKFSDDKDVSKLMDVLFEIWIRYSKITRVPSEVYASRIGLLFGNVFTLMRIVEESMHRNDIALFEKYVGVASPSDRATLQTLLEEVWTRMPEIESKELEPFIEFELLEARERMSAALRKKLADLDQPVSGGARSEVREQDDVEKGFLGVDIWNTAHEKTNAWFKKKYEELRLKSPDFRLFVSLLQKLDLAKGHKIIYLLMGIAFGLSAPPVEISKAVVIPIAALLTMVSPALIVVPVILSLWMGSILRFGLIFLPLWGFTKFFFEKPLRVKSLLMWNFVPFAGAYGSVIGQLWAILGEQYRRYEGISFWSVRNLNRVISHRFEQNKTSISPATLERLTALSPDLAFQVLDFQSRHLVEWQGQQIKVRKATLHDLGLQKKIVHATPALFVGTEAEYEALRQRILNEIESGGFQNGRSERLKELEKKIEKDVRKKIKSRIEQGFSKATQEKFPKQIKSLVDQEVHQQVRERIHERLQRTLRQKAKEMPFYRFDAETYLSRVSQGEATSPDAFFIPLFGEPSLKTTNSEIRSEMRENQSPDLLSEGQLPEGVMAVSQERREKLLKIHRAALELMSQGIRPTARAVADRAGLKFQWVSTQGAETLEKLGVVIVKEFDPERRKAREEQWYQQLPQVVKKLQQENKKPMATAVTAEWSRITGRFDGPTLPQFYHLDWTKLAAAGVVSDKVQDRDFVTSKEVQELGWIEEVVRKLKVKGIAEPGISEIVTSSQELCGHELTEATVRSYGWERLSAIGVVKREHVAVDVRAARIERALKRIELKGGYNGRIYETLAAEMALDPQDPETIESGTLFRWIKGHPQYSLKEKLLPLFERLTVTKIPEQVLPEPSSVVEVSAPVVPAIPLNDPTAVISVPENPASAKTLVATASKVEPASVPADVGRDEVLATAIAEAERKQQAEKKARAARRLKGWRVYFEESVQGPRTFAELSGRASKALYRTGIYYEQQFKNSLKSGYAIMDEVENLSGVGETVKREVFAFLKNQGRFAGIYKESDPVREAAPKLPAEPKVPVVKTEKSKEAEAPLPKLPISAPVSILLSEDTKTTPAPVSEPVPAEVVSSEAVSAPSDLKRFEETKGQDLKEGIAGSKTESTSEPSREEVPKPAEEPIELKIPADDTAQKTTSSKSVASPENKKTEPQIPAATISTQSRDRVKNKVAFFVNVKKAPSVAESLQNFLTNKERRKALPSLFSYELLGVDLFELVFDEDKLSSKDPMTLLVETLQPNPVEVEIERHETLGIRVIKFTEKEFEEEASAEDVLTRLGAATSSDESEFDEDQQADFVRDVLGELGLSEKEIKGLNLSRIYQLYDRQETEALEDYFLEEDLNELAERLDDFILRMDETISNFTDEPEEDSDTLGRSEVRLQQVYAGVLSATLRQQPADQNLVQDFTRQIRVGGVERTVQGLREAFDNIFLPEAMAAMTDREASAEALGYGALENALHRKGLTREVFDSIADQIFALSLKELAEAIRKKEVSGISPVIFYAPQIKTRLVRFVETIQGAFEKTGDVTGENYRITIVSENRVDLAEFKTEVSKRGALRGLKFIESQGADTVAAQLASAVTRHPVFGDKFGVFFPESDLGQSVAWQRVVRSEIPKEYSMLLLPALSRYFATVSTSQINATTLRQALPDLVASAAFRVGQGIAIVAAFLEHLAAAEKQIAASA
jgi:multiple antibiotic resistance protein